MVTSQDFDRFKLACVRAEAALDAGRLVNLVRLFFLPGCGSDWACLRARRAARAFVGNNRISNKRPADLRGALAIHYVRFVLIVEIVECGQYRVE